MNLAALKSVGPGVVIHEPVVILHPEVIELGEEVRIDSFVKLEGGVRLAIGPWVHIASFAHVNIGGGDVELGAESAVASGAKILGGSALLEWPSMSAAARPNRAEATRAITWIGPRAAILTNAVVLPGLSIGADAILAAGAVATRHVPPGEVWAGVPARKVGERHRGRG